MLLNQPVKITFQIHNLENKIQHQTHHGWVFGHAPECVDLLVALQNMSDMEDRDELPSEVRPAYRDGLADGTRGGITW